MNHKLNTDKTALVSKDYYWLPIDENTPLGVKLLLINQSAGVATLGKYFKTGHFTHYAALPKFKKEHSE